MNIYEYPLRTIYDTSSIYTANIANNLIQQIYKSNTSNIIINFIDIEFIGRPFLQMLEYKKSDLQVAGKYITYTNMNKQAQELLKLIQNSKNPKDVSFDLPESISFETPSILDETIK